MSVFFAKQLTQLVFLVTAEFKFLPVGHHHAMVTVKPGLDFADALEIDDGGAIDAYESFGIQLCFHLIHVAANKVSSAIAVKTQIDTFGLNPLEIAQVI